MLDILLMVVIGGMGTMYGAIVGAAIFNSGAKLSAGADERGVHGRRRGRVAAGCSCTCLPSGSLAAVARRPCVSFKRVFLSGRPSSPLRAAPADSNEAPCPGPVRILMRSAEPDRTKTHCVWYGPGLQRTTTREEFRALRWRSGHESNFSHQTERASCPTTTATVPASCRSS